MISPTATAPKPNTNPRRVITRPPPADASPDAGAPRPGMRIAVLLLRLCLIIAPPFLSAAPIGTASSQPTS